jgi:hypothetical protein
LEQSENSKKNRESKKQALSNFIKSSTAQVTKPASRNTSANKTTGTKVGNHSASLNSSKNLVVEA